MIRAVFVDGRLWLLSDAGELSAIEPSGSEREPQHLPEPALDLCVSHGQPQVVTGEEATAWTIRTRAANGTWATTGDVPRHDDRLIAMRCADSGMTTLLSHTRLIEMDGQGRTRSVDLQGTLPPGIVSATYDDEGALYVAINGGEWGGGLQRIDRLTGTVTPIERKGADICSGPLNGACDPVNGITAEPWNPRCLAVAVGLVHMMAHGRIVQVCGNDIRELYAKPYVSAFGAEFFRNAPSKETTPFFGLIASGGSLWAAGTDGLYRIDASGKATMRPLPAFKTIGGGSRSASTIR
ncbi:hypothetical protein [Dyella japonica]|uniref:hypothetical protein n=1 Tax=Dyella japonica TaxID=231455 RepID=UPI0002DF7869|nr:hypothetical protein [Dyella japonica]